MSRAYKTRIKMAELGWMSKDAMTDMGWGEKIGFTIWFSRWDWHGNHKRGNDVCFFALTDKLDPRSINKCVELAAARALEAWNKFPDPCDCPSMNANGEIVNDLSLKKIMQEGYKAPTPS